MPRMLTHADLAEFDLPNQILVSIIVLHLSSHVLWDDIDLDLADLVNNLLDVELDEPIKRGDLLRHQTMLLEVATDDRPCILSVDVVRR